MSESLSKKTFKSSIWSIIDVLLRQGLSFIISIILARLLSPSDYGTIGLLMIFISFAQIFVDSGFASGLIRKVDRTENDLSTAFFFNIGVGIIVYLILFAIAPLAADFFNNQDLTVLLRVLGLVLVINSFNLVQNAILIYTMRIKQLATASACAQISTGICAIILAYRGFGVWALIIQQLASALFTCIFLNIATKWKPKLIFNKSSFQYLWKFGSRLLAAQILGTIFNQAYPLIIGKFLGKHNLGLYTRSQQFAQQPNNILSNIIQKSLVPSLVECQNNLERLRQNYQKCVEVIAFISFPLMMCLAAVGRPLFLFLFGQKWVEAIPIFQILCLGFAVDIFSTISLNLMQIMGRTDYTLKLEIIKKSVCAIFIAVSCSFGFKGIVIGTALYYLAACLMNLSVVQFLLHYNYFKQLADIFKYALITVLFLLPLYLLIKKMFGEGLILLFCLPILFAVCYFCFCYLFKVPVINYLKSIKSKS